MNTRKLTLLFTALVSLAVSAFAQSTPTEATVARVTGSATVTLPDGSTQPLTAGMKVAQGATITTGADGDVYLESHAGYVTAIKKDSVVEVNELSVTSSGGKVTEEKTLLDLKSGNLVANLDPKKKSVNNYQVRTPKGVAAARGTTFTVQYKGGTYTVAVVNGAVTIARPNSFGKTPATIAAEAGAASVTAGNYLSEARGDDAFFSTRWFGDNDARRANNSQVQANDLTELLALAVATVTIAAQNGIGGTTPAEAAAVAKAVFTAAPSAAAQTAAIIKNSGGDTSSSNPVIEAIRNEVPAAQQGAFDSSASTGTFQQTTINQGARSTETTTTTPQAIDPSTVSRSNEE